MATKEITPFETPVDDRTDDAIAGEVVTPEDELKDNERIIRRGWRTATQKVGEIYKALTIIHTKNLWKMHVDADGKRKYTAFDAYLFGEFGWTMDRTRALQIIKATRAEMLESGELSPDDMPKERTREAPQITATKAAQVTSKQFDGALEAFRVRLQNIEYGPGRDDLEEIYDRASSAVMDIMVKLQGVIDDEAQRAADEKERADSEKMERAAPSNGDTGATLGVSPLRN